MSNQYNNAGRTLLVDEIIEVKSKNQKDNSSFQYQLDSQLVKRDTKVLMDQIALISSDKHVTPAEKVVLKRELQHIQSNHVLIVSKSEDLGITEHTSYLEYQTAYQELTSALDVLLQTMDEGSDIQSEAALSELFSETYRTASFLEEKFFRYMTGMLGGLDYRVKFELVINSSSGLTVPDDNTPSFLTVMLLQEGMDVTKDYGDSAFTWARVSEDRTADSLWKGGEMPTGKTLSVTIDDLVNGAASFLCTFKHYYGDSLYFMKSGFVSLSKEIPGPPGAQGIQGPPGHQGELGIHAEGATLHVDGFLDDGSLQLGYAYLFLGDTRISIPSYSEYLSGEGQGYVAYDTALCTIRYVRMRTNDSSFYWSEYDSLSSVSPSAFYILGSFKKTGFTIHDIKLFKPQSAQDFAQMHFMEILSSGDIGNINLWAEAHGIDVVFEKIAILEAFINTLVANSAFISQLEAQQVKIEENGYLAKLNSTDGVMISYQGDPLFSVNPNTGIIHFGQHFWYDPTDETIHTPGDRLLINSNGQLDGDAIQIIKSMNSMQLQPLEEVVFPADENFLIDKNSDSLTTIGEKLQTLFVTYSLLVKPSFSLPSSAISHSENGVLYIAAVANNNSTIELYNSKTGLVQVGMSHYLERYHSDTHINYEIGTVQRKSDGSLRVLWRTLVQKDKVSGAWLDVVGPWVYPLEGFRFIGIPHSLDIFGDQNLFGGQYIHGSSINFPNVPKSSNGLVPGSIWADGEYLKIVI